MLTTGRTLFVVPQSSSNATPVMLGNPHIVFHNGNDRLRLGHTHSFVARGDPYAIL
jgi:hypothetical protein